MYKNFQQWAWDVYLKTEEFAKSLTEEEESATIKGSTRKGVMRKTKEGKLVVATSAKRAEILKAATIIVNEFTWSETVQGAAYWDRVYQALISLSVDGKTKRLTPRSKKEQQVSAERLSDELDKIVVRAISTKKTTKTKVSAPTRGRRRAATTRASRAGYVRK